MTRFWLETGLGAAEAALALRIVWLILRTRRWNRRYQCIVQDRDYRADTLWYLFRGIEAGKAQDIYEARVGYPADTARPIVTEELSEAARRQIRLSRFGDVDFAPRWSW